MITHWDRVTHICVSQLIIIGSDNGLSPDRRQAIIWNKWWNIVIWTLGKKFQWNLNRNLYIFIQENAFENVVWKLAVILSRPQCVKSYQLFPCCWPPLWRSSLCSRVSLLWAQTTWWTNTPLFIASRHYNRRTYAYNYTLTKMSSFRRNSHHWFLTTSSAASDENFVKMTTLLFQCICICSRVILYCWNGIQSVSLGVSRPCNTRQIHVISVLKYNGYFLKLIKYIAFGHRHFMVIKLAWSY